MFEVYFGNKRAKKDYKSLDEKTKLIVSQLCGVLSQTPVPFRDYDIRKIGGREGNFRIRIGSFRILYYVDEIQHKIYVLAIERRSETTYK